jgi:hypothetical protein
MLRVIAAALLLGWATAATQGQATVARFAKTVTAADQLQLSVGLSRWSGDFSQQIILPAGKQSGLYFP